MPHFGMKVEKAEADPWNLIGCACCAERFYVWLDASPRREQNKCLYKTFMPAFYAGIFCFKFLY